MRKKLLALCGAVVMTATLLTPFSAFADTAEDMRGVWMSTVYSVDFPCVKNDANAQKADYIKKLDKIVDMGLNTVVVQVRPKGDALYTSEINPWSEVLTGEQGKNPGYDSMAFMIEEAHKRGLQFHAWLNPYRITTQGTDLSALAENHPARLHPDWVLTYKNALYYNPALDAVKQHISDTVKEIVTRYSVDAIHFDDYFYPTNYPLPEGETRDGIEANARRAHITDMIQRVSTTIHTNAPNVKFGISPMGIWKNQDSDPAGSQTKGGEGYYNVCADVRTWIQSGYIDYVAPQIYWPTGTAAADYDTLVKWWKSQVEGTKVQLYIGQGVYKDEVSAQIGKQLRINDTLGADGSIFFSLQDLLQNRMGAQTQIREHYKQKDVLPTVPAESQDIPAKAPSNWYEQNGMAYWYLKHMTLLTPVDLFLHFVQQGPIG